MDTQLFEMTAAEAGERLDKALSEKLPEFSRVQVQELIKTGMVQVNAKIPKASYRVEAGDRIEVSVPPREEQTGVEPEAIPLEVLYEDEHLIAINKPAGLVVHIGHGNESGTLVNALIARWPKIADVGDIRRAGIVHRLDKDTSGIILVAQTEQVQRKLMSQFQQRDVKKIYWTLVDGAPKTEVGRIEAPIGRDVQQRKMMAVTRSGREAITNYRTLEKFEQHTLLEVQIETGRTHQIRVHMAFLGSPVTGDTVYGYRKPSIKMGRFFLHAKTISFTHPMTGQAMTLDTDLPAELQAVLARLRQL